MTSSSSSVRPVDYLVFNFCMLCIGTSGFLGRSLSLAPPSAIWWRSAVALIFLAGYCRYRNFSFSIPGKKDQLAALAAGVLLTLHLVTYFYALQWSNVAVAMLAVFTFPAMTTLLEPLLLRKPFEGIHLLLGLLVLVGVYFLAPEFDLSNDTFAGLVMGLFSAFVFALRNILMKVQVAASEPSVLMYYQMVIVVVILLPVLFIYPPLPPSDDVAALVALGVVTTCIGHTLFVRSFRLFSVSTASLMSSIQPIYGILLGLLFLGEIPGWGSIIGGTIIVGTVVIEAGRSR